MSPKKAVMILEDEVFVAMDLADMVEELGCEVFGPFHNVKSALAALEDRVPHLALLDVNLGSSTSEPVARRLMDMNVPFAFATGYSSGKAEVPMLFPESRCLSKPFQTEQISRLIAEELSRPEG
jgi:two-component SAPR family response regulator